MVGTGTRASGTQPLRLWHSGLGNSAPQFDRSPRNTGSQSRPSFARLSSSLSNSISSRSPLSCQAEPQLTDPQATFVIEPQLCILAPCAAGFGAHGHAPTDSLHSTKSINQLEDIQRISLILRRGGILLAILSRSSFGLSAPQSQRRSHISAHHFRAYRSQKFTTFARRARAQRALYVLGLGRRIVSHRACYHVRLMPEGPPIHRAWPAAHGKARKRTLFSGIERWLL